MTGKILKHTPLFEFHRTHGKMIEFAGYEMPIWYTSTVEEHMAVRNRAGIFDVSHMGRVKVSGPDATKFLETILPTSLAKQPGGKSLYTLLLNKDAGIIDDLIVLKMTEEKYLLVVNAASREKDIAHMKTHTSGLNLTIEDITESTTMIAIQGPSASEALQPLTQLPLPQVSRFTHHTTTIRGIPAVVTRTGYTGEDGFEAIIYDTSADSVAVWDGLAIGAKPCGLGARDSLRLEAGLPLYGSDMDETTNPLEAELNWVISKEKESYIGSQKLAALMKRGPIRQRRGIIMQEGIPRRDCKITNTAGNDTGVVTSGTYSPILKCGIAMGYIRTPAPGLREEVKVIIRGAPATGRIARPPFYDDTVYGWKRKRHQ